MNSIRKLWWVGAVAIIAACDPYDDENKGPPSILSAFASNADEAAEGELVDGFWTIRSSSVCEGAHLAPRGVVPRGASAEASTIADIPVVYVKTNKLLDGASIQADPLSCDPAVRDGAPWLKVTRVVGATETDDSANWLSCYNPSSPTSSEGASIIIYRGEDVSGGVAGDGWFAVSEVEGDAAEVATYRIEGTVFDRQGNALPVNVAFELEPDAGPIKSFRATELAGSGDAVTANFEFTPGACGSATEYVVQKVTGKDADGDPIWTALEGATFTVADPPATTYSFTDTVTAGEVYDYRIRATVPGVGEEFTETAGEYTLTALEIPAGAPTAAFLPAEGTGTAAKPNRISVNTSATALPAGASAFVVLRATEDESIATEDLPGAFSVVAPEVGLAGSTTEAKFPFEDTKLSGCQQYFYALAVTDADGNVGPYGDPSPGVKSPVAKVAAPTLEAVTAGGVKVTWKILRGALTYDVQRAPDAAGVPGTYETIAANVAQPANPVDPTAKAVTTANVTDATAAAGTKYHYRVNVATSDSTLCSDVVTTSTGTAASITR
ncbi:hypothetical protein [Anaeromyxobacter sp. Fw109-5]|uniref:hypothetical protein n=1 Tax=Anaeromyxobacter sp. (strain Fw109-5) TaxID=404589 RepID=UPI000158A603|nr:hypothetical protein [Anaeromyxobacter sp. Fw109-5]ABS24510.1 hypothetical protein Anae109_0293 [Anaeromyxobacter sp. Fw109-5]